MSDSLRMTPGDWFNLEVPRDAFPADGMAARAALAVAQS